MNIAEAENELVVSAEVAGCRAEDIDMSVHGNTLTISGQKKAEQEEKKKGYYHVERSYGSFRRDLNLGTEVDTEKIEAAYKDGILTITLPKSAKAGPVKVKVKVSKQAEFFEQCCFRVGTFGRAEALCLCQGALAGYGGALLRSLLRHLWHGRTGKCYSY